MTHNPEKTYNKLAKLYDYFYGLSLQDGRLKLAKLLVNQQGNKLIEIGVGTGLMLSLYPENFEIVGVDISNSMLNKALEKAAKIKNKKINLYKINGENTDFLSESFDHVVLPYVYSVSPNPDQLMIESFRLCKTGGTIWILNHFTGFGGIWDFISLLIRPISNFIGFKSEFSFKKHVESKQWHIEEIYKVNIFNLSRIVKIKKL